MDITHKQRETLGFQTQKNVISNTLYAVLYTRVINKMYRFFSTYIYLSIDRLFYCVCTCAVYTNVALVINKEKCAYDLWSLKVIVAVLVFSQPILEFLFQFPISYMLVYPKHIFLWMNRFRLGHLNSMHNKLHFLYTPTICTNWCSGAPWCLWDYKLNIGKNTIGSKLETFWSSCNTYVKRGSSNTPKYLLEVR